MLRALNLSNYEWKYWILLHLYVNISLLYHTLTTACSWWHRRPTLEECVFRRTHTSHTRIDASQLFFWWYSSCFLHITVRLVIQICHYLFQRYLIAFEMFSGLGWSRMTTALKRKIKFFFVNSSRYYFTSTRLMKLTIKISIQFSKSYTSSNMFLFHQSVFIWSLISLFFFFFFPLLHFHHFGLSRLLFLYPNFLNSTEILKMYMNSYVTHNCRNKTTMSYTFLSLKYEEIDLVFMF